MTRRMPGPPPGAGQQAPGEGFPSAGGTFARPGASYPVDPRYRLYPPGEAPIPPRLPRRSTPIVAPLMAFVALLVVGAASLFLFDYLSAEVDSAAVEAAISPEPVAPAAAADETAAVETDAPGATDDPAAIETDEPDVVSQPDEEEGTAEPIVILPPSDERADVTGSLLFTRLGGDIWVASGTTMQPLTNSSSTKADSTPVWSPDGRFVYFIRSTKTEVTDGKARRNGKYTLYPTDLMRMRADGSRKEQVFKSLISDGRGLWFSHVLQPSVSSAGNNVAVVSDGNDGEAGEVVLHIIDSRSGRMRKVSTPSEPVFGSGLGHNDPDFSADGAKVAFTYNDNNGSDSKPRIAILTCQSKSRCTDGRTKYLRPGYANPSWSPNGRLLAVETIEPTGRDIAIITAKGGHERVRLTFDGDSFAPEFSPNGDQVAYLKRDGLRIDVRVMTLAIDDRGKITLVDDRPVTSDGEVDGDSGLSWHIPRSELSRSVDAGEEEDVEPSEAPADEVPEGAPPPPPGS